MAPKRVQFEYAGKRSKKKSLVSQYLTGLGSLFLLRICILNSESEFRSGMVGAGNIIRSVLKGMKVSLKIILTKFY